MMLVLNKPILDTNNNYVKKLEYDLYNLTIKDFNNIEKLYFNLNFNNTETLTQESQFIYKICAFFISSLKFNKNLSFVEFLRIKGKDRRRIVNIVEGFFIPNELMSKKKDLN